jgi:hypothetical protein
MNKDKDVKKIAMLVNGMQRIQDLCGGKGLSTREVIPPTCRAKALIHDITARCIAENESEVSIWLENEKDKALAVQREQLAQFAEKLGYTGLAVAIRHDIDQGRTLQVNQEGWCSHGVSLKSHCKDCGF